MVLATVDSPAGDDPATDVSKTDCLVLSTHFLSETTLWSMIDTDLSFGPVNSDLSIHSITLWPCQFVVIAVVGTSKHFIADHPCLETAVAIA